MILTESQVPEYDAIANHYDLMMQDRTPFLDHYISLLNPGMRSILDIACGTGVVTMEMNRRLRALVGSVGVRVVGVDISPGMLDVARRIDASIEWIQADMRQIPDRCGPVDLAICCYNSLQHLDAHGLGLAFRSIRSVLAAGGRFAFDIYRPNLPYLRESRTDTIARQLHDSDGTRLEIREDSVFDEKMMLLRLNWRLVHADAPFATPLAQTSYELWQHQPETIDAALAASGFQVLYKYSDLDQSPWRNDAKKQVVICAAS